jgi:hypothetical protein
MATTKTAAFTSSGNWTCPASVTAVWMTMVGGGDGAPGTGSGGGGAGELVVARPISVIPGNVYSVVIGAAGVGAAADPSFTVQPTLPGPSSFNGFNALGGARFATVIPSQPGIGFGTAGGGGGAGGSPAGTGGGGFNPRGVGEAAHYFGGCAGGYGDGYYDPCAVGGGVIPAKGTVGPHPGGPGAGSIWGGSNGCNDHVGNVNADPTHYGASAGGNGDFSGPGGSKGGNGCAGYVMLMWTS